MHLQVGQIVTALFLSAPAEVKQLQPRAGCALLEVVLDNDHHANRSLRLTGDRLRHVSIVERNAVALTDNAEDFFFLIRAHRTRLAYQVDPQLAVIISQGDPLPHQSEAVYHYALESPRIRFLIADAPGAGKTIMAGLIIKELQYRGLTNRILVVAPGHLKPQWQREKTEKLQTSFASVDRARQNSAWGGNAWEERDGCIKRLTSSSRIRSKEG